MARLVIIELPNSIGTPAEAREFVRDALHAEWQSRYSDIPRIPPEPQWLVSPPTLSTIWWRQIDG
jgi:hypothetical protein